MAQVSTKLVSASPSILTIKVYHCINLWGIVSPWNFTMDHRDLRDRGQGLLQQAGDQAIARLLRQGDGVAEKQDGPIRSWFFMGGAEYNPYTSAWRKVALVEGLSHDLVCTGSTYHVHFAWQVWHGQLSPRFKFNKLKSFSGVEIDQNHVDKRILGGKSFAVGRLKRHTFCPASVYKWPYPWTSTTPGKMKGFKNHQNMGCYNYNP